MPNFTWRTNTRQRLSLSFPEVRCSLAVTAKKCTKKRDAGAGLLFCQPRPIAVLVDGAVVVAYEHKRKQILCSDWLPQLTRWAYSPPPPHTHTHTHSRDYRQTKIWFYRQFRDRGKLDQESWSPMLGIFSTPNSTIHSNFLQLVTPSLLVEGRSTEFGICGTKALN